MGNAKYLKTLFVAGFIASVVSLSVAGCSNSTSGGDGIKIGSGEEIISYEDMQKEYAQSIQQLSWPESYTPPKELKGEDKKSSYQRGYGDLMLL